MKEKIAKYKDLLFFLYCLILSFLCLLFTSKNSFLYQFNDWVDANAFYTVGKSMMHGIVPYKDIFEQKGLFLYLIYGIGYLINRNTFYGVFIIEVVFFSIFLFFCYKIIKELSKDKYSYYILPIISLIITTSRAFVHGGGAEEFCLPLFSISLYYMVKYFKNTINNKGFIISGICAGLVLMTKYTLLGFWIGMMACICISRLIHKDIKGSIISAATFLLGMFIPFGLSLIYLEINNGIKDFFRVYFLINMTAYTKDSSNFIFSLIKGVSGLLHRNGIFILLLTILFPFLIIKLNINKEFKYSIIITYFISAFFLFFGLVFYSYYILPLFVFILLSLIGLFDLLGKYLDRINIKFTIVILLLVPLFAYNGANYKKDIGKSKDDFFMYKYAEIINKDKNATLVNMGYLDFGLYTVSDILPSTYYFELQNFKYEKFPDNIDSFKKYIDNKETTYILFSTRSSLSKVKKDYANLFEYYELIEDDIQVNEGDNYNMFLFKVKQE